MKNFIFIENDGSKVTIKYTTNDGENRKRTSFNYVLRMNVKEGLYSDIYNIITKSKEGTWWTENHSPSCIYTLLCNLEIRYGDR